jgi:ABC-2 type transport system permease protein
MGTFALNGSVLLLNRVGVVALAAAFFAVSVQSFARTERDRTATLRRLRKDRLGARAVLLGVVAALPIAIVVVLAVRVRDGFQGHAAKDRQAAYQRELAPEWSSVAPLSITSLDLALDLVPEERSMRVTGEYTMVNLTGEPVMRAPFTLGDGTTEVAWRVNGQIVPATNRFGLHVLSLSTPIAPGDTVRMAFDYHGRVPNGSTRNGGGVSHFILSSGVQLSTREAGFVPVPGFIHKERGEALEGDSASMSLGDAFQTRIAVTAPSEFTVNAVGRKMAESSDGGMTTVVWESEGPVTAFNVLAGRWDVRRREGTAVFYHPAHERNVDHILSTLAAARRRYSEWFYPYPWEELRLSEVPNMETNATAFPTNISFSEGIGFLTGGSAGDGQAFSVTAHEAAHQWWGHILTAGEGPGTGLLIEGMANYATLLLHEAENGADARLAFARWLEQGYTEARRVDTERPLLETYEGRRSDEAVLSFKGAFVMWMLHNQLGRERMLAGLQAFVSEHAQPRHHATPEELVETLRGFAPDSAAYQEFVDQWMTGLVLPEIQIRSATVAQTSGGWRVSAELENVGTGTVSLELAAEAETPDSPGERTPVTEVRTTVLMRPGIPQLVSWVVPFAPGRIVVDPDAVVLQLNRARALARLEPAEADL